jgi:hypothetical protein
MYRQLRRGGGITNAVPRQGYFLGDIVDKAVDFVSSAGKKVGDVLGSVAEKVDIKDLASIAALASGNPQLAASIQSMGGGTGNPLIDGLQIYSMSKGKGFPMYGMPDYGTETSENKYLRAIENLATGYIDDKTKDDDKEKKTTTQTILEKLLSPKGIASLTGGYLSYRDQKRVNEALQRQYENYRRAEEEKYKQYKTGQGLQGMTVSNRTVQQNGTGIAGLNIRTNPQGVREIDYRQTGGFVPPIGIKEKADDIPAMLSNNEFVFTADAVRGAGNGDVKEGAKKMYAMMKMYEGEGRA